MGQQLSDKTNQKLDAFALVLLLIDMEKDSSISLLATGAKKRRKSFGKQ
jgi:hypothetical protein